MKLKTWWREQAAAWRASAAKARQRELDQRWVDEFEEIYELRVEWGFTREQADDLYDGHASTELSNIRLTFFGLYDETERARIREGMHDTIDETRPFRRGPH